MSGFYGHLVPSPMDELHEDQFLSLTQYYSSHCILVNHRGRRFTDESLGDEVSNQATLGQPGSRAVLICDERIHVERAATAPYPHGAVADRIAAAEAVGGRFVRAWRDARTMRRGGGRRHHCARCAASDAAASNQHSAVLRRRGPADDHLHIRRTGG
jgi:hypothetical protein